MPSPTLAGFPAVTGGSAPGLGEGSLGVRVVVRTPTVETFIQKYSRFVKEDRIFIFTKSSQPPGTRLRFTLELTDGKPLVAGEGTVTRVRPDTGDPSRPPGMELRFIPTDEASRKIVALMLEERKAHGPTTAPHRAVSAPASPAPRAESPSDPGQTAKADAKSKPAAASPLLTRSLAGGPKGLPSRPGTLQKPGPSSGETAPGAESRGAALARTLLAEAPQAPAPTPEPAATPETVKTESTPAQAEPAPVREEAAKAGPEGDAAEASAETATVRIDTAGEPAPVPTERTPPSLFEVANEAEKTHVGGYPTPPIDPESLFAGAESSSPTTPIAVVEGQAIASPDDLAHSFPGLAQAPAFAEGWRDPAASGPGLVPANPFSEVSDGAIEYFVEWSLERSTAPAAETIAGTAFGAVEMRAPSVVGEEVEPPARRNGTAIGLAIGLGIGLLAGGLGVGLLRGKPSEPVVATKAAPRPVEPAAAPTPSEPSPAEPSAPPAPVAAVNPTPAPPVAAAKPAGGPGVVLFDSKPPGATVVVDGEEKGKTPTTLDLAPGPHQVALNLDRYAPWTSTVVAPGTVDAQLRRPNATLSVTSTPAGADVVVNKQHRGKTPVSVTVPAYESYNVEVSLGPARQWKRKVYVKTPSTAVQATFAAVRPTPPPRPEPAGAHGRGIR